MPLPVRPHPEKMHTFAADLTAARALRGTQVPKKEVDKPRVKAVPKEPTPIYQRVVTSKATAPVAKVAVPKKPVPEPKRPNLGQSATIITDTKRTKHQLLPELGAGIATWFKNLTTKKKRSEPQYVVPESSRRHGIIQQAASKSGAVFTADHQELKEQIKRRQAEAALVDEGPEVTWSANTDTGFDLLVAPEGAKPAEQTPTPVHTPAPEIAVTNTSYTTIPAVPPEAPPQPATPANTTITQTTTPTPAPKTKPSQIVAMFVDLTTNTITMGLVGTIALVVLAIFTLRPTIAFFENLFAEAPPEAPVTNLTPITTQATLDTITLTVEQLSSVPSILTERIQNGPAGIAEYAFVAANDTEISPSYLFQLLGFNTTATLRQSLTATRIVSINHSLPLLAISFVDIDTMRGGMFDWEAGMAADFTLLYNLPPETKNIPFTDDNIDGVDVRVIADEQNTYLLYGLVDNHLLVIAHTKDDFRMLLAAIRAQ